jgi:hypothetical protein
MDSGISIASWSQRSIQQVWGPPRKELFRNLRRRQSSERLNTREARLSRVEAPWVEAVTVLPAVRAARPPEKPGRGGRCRQRRQDDLSPGPQSFNGTRYLAMRSRAADLMPTTH